MNPQKNILLVNIGEPIPFDGVRPHRMSNWKKMLEYDGFIVRFLTTDFEHQRKKWITSELDGYVFMKSVISYRKNIGFRRLLNHFLVSISFSLFLLRNNLKPDLIIVSYPTILLSLVAVVYGIFSGTKVIVDVRDKWPDIFETKLIIRPFLIFHKFLKYLIFNFSSFIIAVSPEYLSWTSKNNGDVIPLTKSNVDKINRKLDFTKDLNFIFSGSLGDTYNLDLIFDFSEILSNLEVNHKIYICGDGPRMKECLEKQNKYLNVLIMGWLNNSELQSVLNNSHFGLMFYNPDSPQGWPNKLIEYISNGLPIINTLDGESADLIKKHRIGFNLNEKSTNDFISFAKTLGKSESLEYKRMTQREYDLSDTIFSEANSFKKLKSIINEQI